MPAKQMIRHLVDLSMTVLLLLLMAYSLVGEAAHEWLGVAMLALFLCHHVLNAGWYRNLRKGRYSAFRICQTALAGLLFLTMLGSMASGILMSRYVFDFPPLRGRRELVRAIHLLCAYWGFLLTGLHLGLHGSMVLGAARRMTKAKPSRTRTDVLRLLALWITVYGAAGFYRDNILSYLLLRTHFVFFDYDQPLTLFFADHLAMLGLFAILAYYGGKLLQKRNHVHRSPKGGVP